MVFSKDQEGFFSLLIIKSPTSLEIDDFHSLVDRLEELKSIKARGLAQPYFEDEDKLDEFVKAILQNKKLNEEICKLVLYLTTTNI